ncbi:DUF2027 domain-containing protein [Muribaculum intestinale]|jgi:hypothetical protein|uniref:DUF2027 domain-containing protein n=1 Tax=Muribaculum intestinale TaxID=1796646 RepID=UPI00242E9C77|nr:DUF2027 domain-containing protein [Muribaculum intestinale]
MAQIGDMVRYLNSVGGGRVVRIEGQMAYVDEDGFETPVLLRECVVVVPAQQAAPAARAAKSGACQSASSGDRWWEKELKGKKEKAPSKEKPVYDPTVGKVAPEAGFAGKGTISPKPEAAPDPDDTPEGEMLNIVLAFEAEEPRHLNTTEYDAYIVNDSNYTLFLTYLTRSDSDKGWTLRFAEAIEPHMQVPVQHITRDDLVAMDRVSVQYVAYKSGREFRLKSPVAVEHSIDTTKFFKLHCFRDNVYFDTPVIAIDITRNDVPQRPVVIDSGRLEDAMRSKRRGDEQPQARRVSRNDRKNVNEPIVVDLHISELLDNTAGLDNADMLQVQLREFNRVMEENRAAKGRKIVFIHGKGEGVLRKAILKELSYKYKSCEVQDASFREYGFGATQVTIR